MSPMKILRALTALAGSLALLAPAAFAQQDWPAKPIRINRLTASIVENPKFNQDLATVRWRNLEGARGLQGTADFIREKRARWAAFIKDIGIEPH